MHTTNYYNNFIEVAEDCPVKNAEVPPTKKEEKTIATLQYEMLVDEPYKHTSDDVVFQVYAHKNAIAKKDWKAEREKFFSKGQPCLRSSPLTKRYGWGVHSDEKGKVAIYARESSEYKSFATDKQLDHVKAMRAKKA